MYNVYCMIFIFLTEEQALRRGRKQNIATTEEKNRLLCSTKFPQRTLGSTDRSILYIQG